MSKHVKRNLWLWVQFIVFVAVFIIAGMAIATAVWGLDQDRSESCETALELADAVRALDQQNLSLTYDMFHSKEHDYDVGVDIATGSIQENRHQFVDNITDYHEKKTECLNT